MTDEDAATGHLASQWVQTQQVIGVLLIQFQGHELPLSLTELAEQTGLRKSVLLRALAAAETRGDVVRVGDFTWRRGD
ncbi:hypothetical protein [Roseomonas elaeocarpi]|uniref:HTH iclR-type domain-containing protein n=1 Tax=Roseomonas elaeocarpi TaxID=907779 RepID=A0ABV6JM24_9PROT